MSELYTLITKGESDCSIYVAEPGETTAFAAEELQHYLHQISGAGLKVISKPVAASCITLQIESSDQKRQDAHTITVTKSGIEIKATTSFALLHGVYSLLEMIGCRWFAPDYWFYDEGSGSDIPTIRDISLPVGEYVQQAGFANRKKFVEGGESHTLKSLIQLIDWMPKVGHNVLDFPVDCFHQGTAVWDERRADLTPELRKRGITIEVGGHGFENFITAEILVEHPEWGGMRPDGSREPDPLKRVFCTSNEAAMAFFIPAVMNYLSARSEIDVFSLWPQDTRDWCECVDCRRLGEIEYRHALIINEVARGAKKLRGGLIISAAAYFEPSKPPKNIVFEDNIEIDFCPIVRTYEKRIYDSSSNLNQQYNDLLLEWFDSPAFDGDLNIYEYYRKYAWRSLPILLPRLIADELRYFHSIGVAGIGSYSEAADWWSYELQHYVIAKLSFNPGASVDALLNDYFNHRYGDVAGIMAELVWTLENFLPQVMRIPGTFISEQSHPDSIYEFNLPSQKLMHGYEIKVAQCRQLLAQAQATSDLSDEIKDRLCKWTVLLDYVALEVEARGIALAMSERALDGHLEKYIAVMQKMAELVLANKNNGLIFYHPRWSGYDLELPGPCTMRNTQAILEEMGIQPIINAGGYQTVNGASQVKPEMVAAAAAILPKSVVIDELQALASQAIAEVTGAESGFVTACSAAGITVAVAAAMAGTDKDAILRLPDTSGLKNKIILPAVHDVNFGATISQMIRLSGAELVLAGSREECGAEDISQLIDGKKVAAAVYVINDHVLPGRVVTLEDYVNIMHAHGVPVIVDCAAEYDMQCFIAAGADAVIYSAHKVLNGLTAGIIAGRQDLIAACRLQSLGIGRPMKVGKEGIISTIAALRRWQQLDHEALQAEWRERTNQAHAILSKVDGLTVSIEEDANDNPVPRTKFLVDKKTWGVNAGELKEQLASLEIPILLRANEHEPDTLLIDPRSLTQEEVMTVCQCIAAQLQRSG